jgi:hypothetical protein
MVVRAGGKRSGGRDDVPQGEAGRVGDAVLVGHGDVSFWLRRPPQRGLASGGARRGERGIALLHKRSAEGGETPGEGKTLALNRRGAPQGQHIEVSGGLQEGGQSTGNSSAS